MNDIETRDRVIAAADRLFYLRGIQAVSMDQLRAEAGIPLKRIYAEFPSKEAIVEAVLRHRTRIWAEGVQDATDRAADTRGKLLAVYDFLDRWFETSDFRGCVFINSFGELGATSPSIARIVREQKASFQRYVADLVAEAGGPESLAPQLALLAEGAQTTAAISGDPSAATHARAAAETLIDAALPALVP
ncbi:TetR/AcrR family transcriptional regulator [Lysinimonas soli]|uniref:TetR/AcrR family transcriptional regulator n=1 Tax=Lysinimonas soli TaxID=1074233 RepID=A0ABW0NSK6_9MICO